MFSNKLNLSNTKKPTTRDGVIIRRNNILNSINKQLNIVNDRMNGVSYTTNGISNRKIAEWFWLDSEGNYFLSIKYGKNTLELDKGKHSILCKDLKDVITSLNVVKDMVLVGGLDTILEKSSIVMRKNFNR